MADDDTILGRAIAQIADDKLRETIEREVKHLRNSRRFGLVFDRHLPESGRLVGHPIRRGLTVALRDESTAQTWQVARVRDGVAVLDDGGERPASDLVVLRNLDEPIYPGLESLERISRGNPDAPWHTVINGENLHALQILRQTHRGKVDLIYIDPPYNTGNDGWIYSDKFVLDADRAKSSKWLSFMERRLDLAKHLLKPTGVIIVAIGDDEHHRLRMLMDQVFGAENFISNVVWQGGRKSNSRYVSNGADYMVICVRDHSAMTENDVRWKDRKPGVSDALEAAERAWQSSGHDQGAATRAIREWIRENRHELAEGVTRYNTIDDEGRLYFAGDLSSPAPRPNLMYDLLHPTTGLPVKMHPNGWRHSREVMDTLVANGQVLFGRDHTTTAYYKRLLADQLDETASSVFERDRRASSAHLRVLLNSARFENPKDVQVLMRWFRMVAPKDAVIVDFFVGSGSTTEAVMRLNAEDGGTRQSIVVTNNEVGSRTAKELRKAGHHPGDDAWEERGVFEYVARPRISTVVTGARPDGSTYSDGLDANVEFLKLTYLDPNAIRRGRDFASIAPLLWLEAGAVGERIDGDPGAGFAVTDRYAVLFDVDQLSPFIEALDRAEPPRAYVLTDSPAELRAVRSRVPASITVIALPEAYLDQFGSSA